MARTVRTLALVLALAAASPAARANGRFPNAGLVVVGPGPGASVVAVQLTFGLALSLDAGRSWRWVCEDAFSTPSGWDPPLAIAHDGALHLALLDGMRSSANGCAWTAPPGVGAITVIDVAQDATGLHLVAGVGAPGDPNGVMTSDDGGRTWATGARVPGMFLTTVEIAPGRPSRLYATMNSPEGLPALYRSDDGGRTLVLTTRTFDGNDAWLAAVDPTDPDVLYVRSTLGVETRLLKSTDGGMTFARVTNVEGPMTGFALSDDGATVWVATDDPTRGILRSVRGGPFTRMRATAAVRCMRFHAGVLYVCGTEAVDGWALACSTDGGDRLDPLLSLRSIDGPLPCPPGSPVRDRCEALWPAQRRLLVFPDAGGPPTPRPHVDAGLDVGLDASDVLDVPDVVDAFDVVDAAAERDAPDAADRVTVDRASGDLGLDATRDVSLDAARGGAPPRACGCRAVGRGRGSAAWWLLALTACVRRRRAVRLTRQRTVATAPRLSSP